MLAASTTVTASTTTSPSPHQPVSQSSQVTKVSTQHAAVPVTRMVPANLGVVTQPVPTETTVPMQQNKVWPTINC